MVVLAGALGASAGYAVVGHVGQLYDDCYRMVRRESPDSLVRALQRGKDFYVQ